MDVGFHLCVAFPETKWRGGVIVFLHAGNSLQSWLKIGVLQSAVFCQKSQQTKVQEKYQLQQLKLLRHGRYVPSADSESSHTPPAKRIPLLQCGVLRHDTYFLQYPSNIPTRSPAFRTNNLINVNLGFNPMSRISTPDFPSFSLTSHPSYSCAFSCTAKTYQTNRIGAIIILQ